MLRPSKFLVIFSIREGVSMIGWVSLVAAIMAFYSNFFLFVAVYASSQDTLESFLFGTTWSDLARNKILVALGVGLALEAVVTVISVWLIQASESHVRWKLQPALWMLALLSAINVYFSATYSLWFVVAFVITFYFVIVIDSLSYERNTTNLTSRNLNLVMIDKFLLIFTLETGGQFLGWLGIITNGLVLPGCVILLVIVCTDKEMQVLHENLDESDLEILKNYGEKTFRNTLICTLVFALVLSALYLLVSVLLVRGVRNRNHRQVKPAKSTLALLSIITVCSVLLRGASVNKVFFMIFYSYFYVVIDSLWRKLKDEKDFGTRPSEHLFQPIASQAKA